MLSKLFTQFDQRCIEQQSYKVYTIGDCYVALGFLEKNIRYSPQEEAYRVIDLGFNMIEIIKKVREEIKFDELNMRIGIHTGKVIGGVIGTDIIRFDIYGEDVTIANEMESQGTKGKITVSQTTMQLISEHYNCFDFEY